MPEAGEPPTGVIEEHEPQAAETEIHHGNQFLKILRHGSWYFAASVLTKLAGLVLVPIYTRYLSPSEYGVLGSLDAVGRLLPLFISLYLDASFIRFYYVDRRISPERVRTLYSTQFWFVAVWGSGICLLGLLLAPVTIQPLVDTPFLPYMPLVFVAPLFTQLGIMGSQVMRADLRAREVSVINIASFVATAAVSLTLLIGFGYGVVSLLWGLAVGPFFSFVIFTVIALRRRLLGLDLRLGRPPPQPALLDPADAEPRRRLDQRVLQPAGPRPLRNARRGGPVHDLGSARRTSCTSSRTRSRRSRIRSGCRR